MQKRGLFALFTATAIMVAVAVAALATGNAGAGRAGSDQPALPELAQQLGHVASVDIRRSDLHLTFIRNGNDWLVRQKDDYPADSGKVRRIVLALADMTLVEPKTREPTLYPRLEVEDPVKGKSTLVTIKNEPGAAIAALIVGKRRFDRLGEGNDGVYVRKPGDPQSWLAGGSLDFSSDTASWLSRGIVDISDTRIAKVELTQTDGTRLMLSRAKPAAKFTVENPPKNAKYKSDTVLGEPATALEALDLSDVQATTKLPVPKGATAASYTTFDGLTVTVELFQHDSKDWIAVTATGSGKGAAEAKKIDDRVSHWVYAIPAYKAKMIGTKFADLLAPANGS